MRNRYQGHMKRTWRGCVTSVQLDSEFLCRDTAGDAKHALSRLIVLNKFVWNQSRTHKRRTIIVVVVVAEIDDEK